MSTSRGPEPGAARHEPDRRSGPPAAGDGPRRQARERALDLLYEAEMKSLRPAEVIAELPVAPADYARRLAEGVGARAVEIDALVDRFASGWALDRLPAVDRQLLRLATYELLGEPAVPAAVVIDEAVELAKAFSTEESGRYVNGVLAAIGRQLGRIDGRESAGEAAGPAPVAAPATPPAPDRRPGGLGAVRASPRARR